MATEVFNNAGNLFLDERLEEIDEYPEWTSDKIEESRRKLEELLEKREAQLQEGLEEMETRYYWISYVLRALGFCYSVAELTPESTSADEDRPDFTLFYSAQDFAAALPYRGDREFFVHGLSVMRSLAWDADLDEVESDDGPYNPALDVDKFIRATGVEWGILTNGRLWRLYHRDSSGLLDTFYEVDLIDALQATDTESFKYFWMVFSPDGLSGAGEFEPLVHRLLH